jgi:hypothetical protein
MAKRIQIHNASAQVKEFAAARRGKSEIVLKVPGHGYPSGSRRSFIYIRGRARSVPRQDATGLRDGLPECHAPFVRGVGERL